MASNSSTSQYEKTAAPRPANRHHDHSDGKRNPTKLNLDAATRRGRRRTMRRPRTEPDTDVISCLIDPSGILGKSPVCLN
jgi:hypothetical protein